MKNILFFIFFISTLAKAETTYIPGEVIGWLASPFFGQFCIPEGSKVGDLLPNKLSGNFAKVRSLDRASKGCENQANPIRADVDFIISKSNVKLSIPESYSPMFVSDIDKFNGLLLKANLGSFFNEDILTISSFRRGVIPNLQLFAQELQKKEMGRIENMKEEIINLKNIKVYKYEDIKENKCLFCSEDAIVLTALADTGKDEIIVLQIKLSTSKFKTEKDRLIGILASLIWTENSI